YLGRYFGGLGWPKFNLPNDRFEGSGIKIPSGQNVIALSPTLNKRSTYSQNMFMLSTGGTEPVQFGDSGHTKQGSAILRLVTQSVADALAAQAEPQNTVVTSSMRNNLQPNTR